MRKSETKDPSAAGVIRAVDLPGLQVTGANPDDKGPLIIEGPGLRPSLRQAVLRLLQEKAR